MRVTDMTKQNTVRQNLNKTSGQLQDIMRKMSSGKRINTPADDPVGAAMVQDFQTSINHSETLQKNIGADKIWLNNAEAAIEQISDTLMHVKELALEGGNGAATKEYRNSVADEILGITKQLVNIANKKVGKLFLFSGTKTFTQPLKMNQRLKEAELFFERTRIKSQAKIIPLDQDKPLKGLQGGSFQIVMDDGTEQPPTLNIELAGNESIRQVAEQINQAAIEMANFEKSEHSISGFEQAVFAEVGNDNSFYLDPEAGLNIRFGEEDSTGFLKLMNFAVVGDSDVIDPELPRIEMTEVSVPNEADATFNGYTKNDYKVKIAKGGSFGSAQYIVSDDGGKTWGMPQVLGYKNEIYNPDGKASDKVFLEFAAKGKPFFKEGLEFRFEGNEFVEYRGNIQPKEVLIDNGIKVALNVNANELFFKDPEEESVDTFEVLNRLTESLSNDDSEAVLESIEEINQAINQVLDKRGRIGTVYRELEASEERIEADVDFKTGELGELEDLDMAKASIDLNNAELKHKTSLDTTSRLVQPTLIDFLR